MAPIYKYKRLSCVQLNFKTRILSWKASCFSGNNTWCKSHIYTVSLEDYITFIHTMLQKPDVRWQDTPAGLGQWGLSGPAQKSCRSTNSHHLWGTCSTLGAVWGWHWMHWSIKQCQFFVNWESAADNLRTAVNTPITAISSGTNIAESLKMFYENSPSQ